MRVFLGIGSNLEPKSYIVSALESLSIAFGPLQKSRQYRTPAIGFVGPSFINMAVSIETEMSPEQVAQVCHRIERELGRNRNTESGSCSRCIDIDLLLFQDKQTPPDSLPKPRVDIREFAYTAVPLADIIPEWRSELTAGMALIDYVRSERFAEQQVEVISE